MRELFASLLLISVLIPPAAVMAASPTAAVDRDADPAGAVTYWEQRLTTLSRSNAARGLALWNLAAALVAASRSAEALLHLQEAEPLLTGDGDRARLHATWGAALADLNRLDEADARLERAIAGWRALAPRGSAEEAGALNLKATIAFSRGDLAAARDIGERSIAMYRAVEAPETAELVGALGNMSTIHLQSRALEPSERYAREAVAMASRILAEDHPTAIVALTNWVAVLAAQNRREESVETLKRIAALRERKFGPDYPPLAITYNNLSRNLMFLGKAAEAEPYARRAVTIGVKTRAPDDQSLAAFRDNLADILIDLDRRQESIALRREAIAGLGPKGNRNRLMRVRTSLGKTLFQAGDDRAALDELRAVAEWQKATAPDSHPDRLDTDSYITLLEARLSEPGAAAKVRSLAALTERELFAAGDPTRHSTDVKAQLSRLLEAAWLTGERQTGFRLAQLLALDEAGRAVAAVSAREGAGAASALIRQRQDLLAARDRQARQALAAYGKDEPAYRSASAAVAESDAALARVESELAAAVPDYAALARFTALDEAAVARDLARDEALLMPTPLGSGALTFVVRRDGVDWARSADSATLTADIEALRAGLGGGGTLRGAIADAPVRRSFDRALAHRIYRTVVPPRLDARLAGASTLLVATSGALTSLPFAALVTEPPRGRDDDPAALRATPWLVRKAALLTLPTLTARNKTGSRQSGDRFVGVGAPLLRGSAAPKGLRGIYRGGTVNRDALAALGPLPAAETELKRMSAALPSLRPTLLTGAAATESAVKTGDLKDVRVLAFATHGLVGGAIDARSEPGLVMTPPPTSTPADDGLLTASEIAALHIDADWVVLSACDTAAGEGAGAPALSGLARAFLYAGARSLLVSHWAVRDDAAARLTVDTASRSGGDGAARAAALRRAMLRLIEDPRVPDGADPAVWAPFILVTR